MRFDWYQATLPTQDHEQALSIIHAGLGGKLVDRGRGMNGYKRSFLIQGPEGTRCTFCFDGNGMKGMLPNAFASGSQTEAFVKTIRDAWPGNHEVSRMDSAEDFESPGAWDKLLRPCLDVVDRLGLKAPRVGDWYCEGNADGRTQYIGSMKSPCFARLYEKGKQQRVLQPAIASTFSLDWIRLEAAIKPSGENRIRASTATPLEAWGYSTTTAETLKACLNLDVVRVPAGRHDTSHHERTMNQLVFQYGSSLEVEAATVGGWQHLGPTLHLRRLNVMKSRALLRSRS